MWFCGPGLAILVPNSCRILELFLKEKKCGKRETAKGMLSFYMTFVFFWEDIFFPIQKHEQKALWGIILEI